MQNLKTICLEFVRKKHSKKVTMKTPFWIETLTRPEPHAILAYEIYSNPINPTEQETIKALNQLVTEKKLTSYFKKGMLWYALPTQQNKNWK